MKNIVLVCAAGMSTSLLVSKMQKVAESKEEEIVINATAGADLSKYQDAMQVLLLGPQVAHLKSKYTSEYSNIPVAVIDSIDYGMMDGEKVLTKALDLIEKNQ